MPEPARGQSRPADVDEFEFRDECAPQPRSTPRKRKRSIISQAFVAAAASTEARSGSSPLPKPSNSRRNRYVTTSAASEKELNAVQKVHAWRAGRFDASAPLRGSPSRRQLAVDTPLPSSAPSTHRGHPSSPQPCVVPVEQHAPLPTEDCNLPPSESQQPLTLRIRPPAQSQLDTPTNHPVNTTTPPRFPSMSTFDSPQPNLTQSEIASKVLHLTLTPFSSPSHSHSQDPASPDALAAYENQVNLAYSDQRIESNCITDARLSIPSHPSSHPPLFAPENPQNNHETGAFHSTSRTVPASELNNIDPPSKEATLIPSAETWKTSGPAYAKDDGDGDTKGDLEGEGEDNGNSNQGGIEQIHRDIAVPSEANKVAEATKSQVETNGDGEEPQDERNVEPRKEREMPNNYVIAQVASMDVESTSEQSKCRIEDDKDDERNEDKTNMSKDGAVEEEKDDVRVLPDGNEKGEASAKQRKVVSDTNETEDDEDLARSGLDSTDSSTLYEEGCISKNEVRAERKNRETLEENARQNKKADHLDSNGCAARMTVLLGPKQNTSVAPLPQHATHEMPARAQAPQAETVVAKRTQLELLEIDAERQRELGTPEVDGDSDGDGDCGAVTQTNVEPQSDTRLERERSDDVQAAPVLREDAGGRVQTGDSNDVVCDSVATLGELKRKCKGYGGEEHSSDVHNEDDTNYNEEGEERCEGSRHMVPNVRLSELVMEVVNPKAARNIGDDIVVYSWKSDEAEQRGKIETYDKECECTPIANHHHVQPQQSTHHQPSNLTPTPLGGPLPAMPNPSRPRKEFGLAAGPVSRKHRNLKMSVLAAPTAPQPDPPTAASSAATAKLPRDFDRSRVAAHENRHRDSTPSYASAPSPPISAVQPTRNEISPAKPFKLSPNSKRRSVSHDNQTEIEAMEQFEQPQLREQNNSSASAHMERKRTKRARTTGPNNSHSTSNNEIVAQRTLQTSSEPVQSTETLLPSQLSSKSASTQSSCHQPTKALKFSSLPNLQRPSERDSPVDPSLSIASQPSRSCFQQQLNHILSMQPTSVRDAAPPAKPASNKANTKTSVIAGAADAPRAQSQSLLWLLDRTSGKTSSLDLPSDSEEQSSPKRPSPTAPESNRSKKKMKHSVITGATRSNPKPTGSSSTKSNGIPPESRKVRTAAPKITIKDAIEVSGSQGRETESALSKNKRITEKAGGSSLARVRGSASKKTVTFAEGATEIPIKPISAANSSASSSKDDLDEHVGNTNGASRRTGKRRSTLKRNRSGGSTLGDRPRRSAKDVQLMCDDLQFSLDILFGMDKTADKKELVAALTKMLDLLMPLEAKVKSPLLEYLRKTPEQLRTIVNGLFEFRKRPAPLPLLAMGVLTVVADGAPECFSREHVEPLVEAFYGSCYDNTEEETGTGHENENRRATKGRYGKIGKRAETVEEVNNKALKEVSKALNGNGLLHSYGLSLKLFKNVTQVASLLAGVVLGKVLGETEEARDGMLKENRLGRICAVLYRTLEGLKQLDGMERQDEVLRAEKDKRMVLLGVAILVFEAASHSVKVKQKIVEESSVMRRTLDYLRSLVLSGRVNSDMAECFASNVIRLLINLVHGFPKGLKQFAERKAQWNGVQVVLDCLASSMGMTAKENRSMWKFDIAVLCLALLVSVVDSSDDVRNAFQGIEPTLTVSRQYGGVAFVLELLKVTWDDVEEGDTGNKEKQMERKVITGYLCLLLGALVRQAPHNCQVIRRSLPNNTLRELAPVITDFLDFHHSVGVNQTDINAMYKRILDGLIVEEALAEKDQQKCIAQQSVN